MIIDQETADHLDRIVNQVDRIAERVQWLDLVLANLDEAYARAKRMLADEPLKRMLADEPLKRMLAGEDESDTARRETEHDK